MLLSALPGIAGLCTVCWLFHHQQFQRTHPELLAAAGHAMSLPPRFALGLVCLISAIRQKQICANGIASIGADIDVFGKTMVLAVFRVVRDCGVCRSVYHQFTTCTTWQTVDKFPLVSAKLVKSSSAQ